jgi:hypothetical protein
MGGVLRSFQLPAASFPLATANDQLPVFPTRVRPVSTLHLLHEAGQHAPDFLELSGELPVQRRRQEPEISGKKEIILKFITGTQGVPQKPPEVRIRASARSFRDV